jgi:uncharacterized protein YecE (DUF72 family)
MPPRTGAKTGAASTPRLLYVGAAGWTVPAEVRAATVRGATHLAVYSTHFSAVEINSSFYRSHRRTTYERWASMVPENFRFSVKVPKTITHEAGLIGAGEELRQFLDEVDGLGAKLAVILVQLPPTLEFDSRTARAFFGRLSIASQARVVCEPRHESWFGARATGLLRKTAVSRAAVDPVQPTPAAAMPEGDESLSYYRLHGSPRMYYSAYDEVFLARLCREILQRSSTSVWCIFDNTAMAASWKNAAALEKCLGGELGATRRRASPRPPRKRVPKSRKRRGL